MTLQELLFTNGDYEKKIAVIDKMTQDFLLSNINSTTISKLLGMCKTDRIGLPSPDTFWNSYVEAVHLSSKGNVLVEIYVQGSSTDTSMMEYWANFVRPYNYSSNDNHLGISVRYTPTQIAEVVRNTLKVCVWKLYSQAAKEKDIIASISNYTIINPVVNYFYDKYRLKYKYSTWAYGGKCREYDAYNNAEKVLKSYIKENYKELYGKSKEELIEIYKKVFQDAMDNY